MKNFATICLLALGASAVNIDFIKDQKTLAQQNAVIDTDELPVLQDADGEDIELAQQDEGEDSELAPQDEEDGSRELPYEAPECVPKPSDEKMNATKGDAVAFADFIDAANKERRKDGFVTEKEVFNTAYCLFKWGEMPSIEAVFEIFD